MKVSKAIITVLSILMGVVASESQVSNRPLIFHNWPPKNAKQLAGKQRTLVVQIRSDQPVPLMFKGRPGFQNHHSGHSHAHTHGHTHAHAHALPHALALHSNGGNSHLRNLRPVKLSAPLYFKPMPNGYTHTKSAVLRKPLKIKLNNSKVKSKPAENYEKPFKFEPPTSEFVYEKPHALYNQPQLENSVHFENEHFVPIHTIPAPNLALQDNFLHAEDINSSQIHESKPQPQPQPYHPIQATTATTTLITTNQLGANNINSEAQYEVFEEHTNDKTLIDVNSGTQKLFAPDPDPSLPASKLRLATEPFNQPSIGKPLNNNHLPPAKPLVHIVDAQQQHGLPEIYPIQFTQQAAIQPFISSNVAAAPIPLYNPTYLVTQSNNLYTQHKQQLYNTPVVEAGYYNADLTQQVASDGRILQTAKQPTYYDSAPQFAALIAAPALSEEPLFKPAAIHLPNVAASPTVPESGFVVSNYYGNGQDSSQLLQAYAEEESQRQRLEAEQASLELQRQKQLLQQEQEEQQLLQQEHNHLLELQQQQRQREQQQQQHQHHLEVQKQRQQEQQHQHHLELQQQQQQFEVQQQQQQQRHHQQQQQQQQQQPSDPAANAFAEHARLVQQQLGNTPLRIFVPDDESSTADLPRLQKRSEDMKRGTVQNVKMSEKNESSMFEVSTSVEVSNDGNKSTEPTADKKEDKLTKLEENSNHTYRP